MCWFRGHRINLSGILVPFLYHHTQMKHMWIFQNHLSYTVFIPAIVKLPSNVLYFRVSGHGYSWNLSTQNHHRYLCLAVPTHLQISSAPLCLRAASGTSARFSNPLMFGELLERDTCAITGELGLSDVIQCKTSKFTICLYAVLTFNCIFHHFDVRLCHKREHLKCRTFC